MNTTGSAAQLPVEVTNETLAAARGELYRTQSCIFITTRILVVDLLTNRLQARQVLRICAKHLPTTPIKLHCCHVLFPCSGFGWKYLCMGTTMSVLKHSGRIEEVSLIGL